MKRILEEALKYKLNYFKTYYLLKFKISFFTLIYPGQYYRIMHEEENVTLMTIFEMTFMMVKKLKISFVNIILKENFFE